MKKLLFILLLLPAIVFAGQGMGPGPGVKTYAVAGECTGYLICQNFEGNGYDNSETWTVNGGSPDPDYTTTVLRGAQSLYMPATGSAELISATFASSGELYVHMLFRTSYMPTGGDQIWKLGTSLYVTLTTANRLSIAEQGEPYRTATTTNALSIDTPYHLWIHYKKATSGDGVGSVEFTALDTYSPVGSGNNFAGFTNGGMTTDWTTFLLRAAGGTGYHLYDQILASSSPISVVAP